MARPRAAAGAAEAVGAQRARAARPLHAAPAGSAPAACSERPPARNVTVVVARVERAEEPRARAAHDLVVGARATACGGSSELGSCLTKSPMSGSEEMNSYSGSTRVEQPATRHCAERERDVGVAAGRVRVPVRARQRPQRSPAARRGRGPGTARAGCAGAARRRAAWTERSSITGIMRALTGARFVNGSRRADVDLREQVAAVAEQRVGLVGVARVAERASGSRACRCRRRGSCRRRRPARW